MGTTKLAECAAATAVALDVMAQGRLPMIGGAASDPFAIGDVRILPSALRDCVKELLWSRLSDGTHTRGTTSHIARAFYDTVNRLATSAWTDDQLGDLFASLVEQTSALVSGVYVWAMIGDPSQTRCEMTVQKATEVFRCLRRCPASGDICLKRGRRRTCNADCQKARRNAPRKRADYHSERRNRVRREQFNRVIAKAGIDGLAVPVRGALTEEALDNRERLLGLLPPDLSPDAAKKFRALRRNQTYQGKRQARK